MELDLFSSVGLVLTCAAILVWVLQKLGQSAIVAYLALGLIVGPSGLDIVPSSIEVQHLSEIGVIFLLFFVGLEFHVSALKSMARLATLGAFAQVGATTAVFAGLGFLAGKPLVEGIILGFGIALSSTAIVMKAFEERREADSATAETCVGLLIGQDLIALLAMALMPFLCGCPVEGPFDLGAPATLGIMVVALPVIFFVTRRFMPSFFKRAAIARNQEAFGLWSLAACLLVAILARAVGASMALGAFLGGLVFAESTYAHQIRADLAVFKNLALGFFFVAVGMLLDLNFAKNNALELALGLVIVLVGKTVVVAVVLRMFRSPWVVAAGSGLALSQVGEFALVLPNIARDRGLLSEENYQYLITLTVLTMLVAPLLVARARPFGRFVAGLFGGPSRLSRAEPRRVEAEDPDMPAPKDPKVRAIVVGYGPVGRTLCRILIRSSVEPCVIDLDLNTIKKLKSIGREGVYGDAGRREVLLAAGLADARYLLITLPDFQSRTPIITSARALNPTISIISRARYLNERQPLERAGAQNVAVEECEVAVELARLLLKRLDVPKDSIETEVARIHTEIETRSGFTRAIPTPIIDP